MALVDQPVLMTLVIIVAAGAFILVCAAIHMNLRKRYSDEPEFSREAYDEQQAYMREVRDRNRSGLEAQYGRRY